MDIQPRFMAYEMDRDGDVQDTGSICTSVEEAWGVISGVFSIDHTIIENLRTGEIHRPMQDKVFFIKTSKTLVL